MLNARTDKTFLGSKSGATGQVVFWGITSPEPDQGSPRPSSADCVRELTFGYRLAQGGFRQLASGRPIVAPEQISDLGNATVEASMPTAYCREIKEASLHFSRIEKRLLVCAPDQLASLGLISALNQLQRPFQVLHLDSQPDVSAGPEEIPNPQGFVRNLLALTNVHKVVQMGVRGYSDREMEYHPKLEIVAESDCIREMEPRLIEGIPLYITVDATAFNPRWLSAVDRPVFGGLEWSDWKAILQMIERLNLPVIGCDWSGFNPCLDDRTQSSSQLVANALIDLALLMCRRGGWI